MEKGFIDINGKEAYQVYRKTLDKEGPLDGVSTSTYSKATNIEKVTVVTYIPYESYVLSVWVEISGEISDDPEKKKISPQYEEENLSKYNQILSTF